MIVVYLWAMNGSDLPSQNVESSQYPLIINWGASARQGRKPSMEDRFLASLPLTAGKADTFFGVYDGHLGEQAADYVMRHLHENLEPRVSFQENNAQALREAFEQTEQELIRQREKSGTTATVAYMQRNDRGEDTVSFAWAGDSRVIMVDKNNLIKFSSADHRPDNPEEALRTGGKLRSNNLTRSLGNFATKTRASGLLIATPEVAIRPLVAGDIIIMASDGLWDTPGIDNGTVMLIVEGMMNPDVGSEPGSNETVVEAGNSQELELMARKIRDIAYQMGSKDNIAVMVVRIEKQS